MMSDWHSWLAHTPDKGEVGGSSPPSDTKFCCNSSIGRAVAL